MAAAIREFKHAKFTKNVRPSEIRVWEQAQDLITELFQGAGIDGDLLVTAHRKVRWQGNPLLPYKIGKYYNGSVFITVKPPGSGNDSPFEYAVRGQAEGWDAMTVQQRLLNHLNAMLQAKKAAAVEAAVQTVKPPAASPPAVSQPTVSSAAEVVTPVTPVKSLSERISELEQISARNDSRQGRVEDLREHQTKKRRAIAALQQELLDLENKEVEVIEAMEKDTECQEARQALSALRKMLGLV